MKNNLVLDRRLALYFLKMGPPAEVENYIRSLFWYDRTNIYFPKETTQKCIDALEALQRGLKDVLKTAPKGILWKDKYHRQVILYFIKAASYAEEQFEQYLILREKNCLGTQLQLFPAKISFVSAMAA